MKKKSLVITGIVLSGMACGAAYLTVNKNARKKAEDMLEFAVDETRNYFEEM